MIFLVFLACCDAEGSFHFCFFGRVRSLRLKWLIFYTCLDGIPTLKQTVLDHKLCFSVFFLFNMFPLHLLSAIFASWSVILHLSGTFLWTMPELVLMTADALNNVQLLFLLFKLVLCFNWFVFSSLLIISTWIWQQGEP